MSPISVPVAVEGIEDREGGVRILTVAPLQPFNWRAGQYAHLSAEGHDTRAFSIASAPQPATRLSFHIRNTGTGLSQHLCERVTLGDMIGLEGPYGDMDAEAARGRPVLMVAGGTGIAPMLALASDILRRGLTEDGITLIYGARSAADIYCRKELDALRSTGDVATHIISDMHTPDQELRRLGLNLAHHIVYVSGPDPMMHAVHSALTEHLADPSRIFTDADMNNLQKAQP